MPEAPVKAWGKDWARKALPDDIPRPVQTITFLLLIGALILGLPWVARTMPPVWTWAAVGVLMIGLVAVIGWTIASRPDGILIEASGMSLARFQLVAWTLLFFSAWPAAVFINFAVGAPDPLGITIPQELLVLLGISATSLVGSPLLQSGRKEFLRDKKKPSWADLFLGEEKDNQGTVDVANVQMFFFTVIIVFAYAVLLLRMFAGTTGPVTEFPAVSESMVALLGISHAGFLANKPIPKSDDRARR